MKLRTETFRCDLCGKHRRIGVTETKAKLPDDPETGEGTQTFVCDVCVAIASDLLAGDDPF
jgi:hypothetical protein